MGSNPIGESDFFPILFMYMYVSIIPLNIVNPHTATTANIRILCDVDVKYSL